MAIVAYIDKLSKTKGNDYVAVVTYIDKLSKTEGKWLDSIN